MTAQAVQNQICVYFGGPYDYPTRSYRTPQVPGLGVVRRAFPKREDEAEFFLSTGPGVGLGSAMVVWLVDGDERRIAFAGATDGRKRVAYQVQLHLFVRCKLDHAEDGQDYAYGLLDAIRDHIHADRTCGSGGFEVGGFQVGEGDAPQFRWHLEQANTSEDVTDLYMRIETDALEIIAA